MSEAIDRIKGRIHTLFPSVKIEQLEVAHPGLDHDGLWFFRHGGNHEEVRLASANYDFPFLVESRGSKERFTAASVDEAVEAVRKFFSRSA